MVAGKPPINFVAILKGSGSSRIVEGIFWVGRRHKATKRWILEKWGSWMGQLYSFECGSCGYYAEVSGGEDAGMIGATTTISCGACRELYDVVVWRVREPELGRIEPQCPESKAHPVTVWNFPGPCPRCGEPLAPDPEGTVTLWD